MDETEVIAVLVAGYDHDGIERATVIHFVRFLREARPGWRLVNLDLLTYAGNPENLADLENDPNFSFVHGDVAHRDTVAGVFARFSFSHVVHFAAETHVDRSILDPGVFVRTNVVGTFNLLEAARLAWGRAGQSRGSRFLTHQHG